MPTHASGDLRSEFQSETPCRFLLSSTETHVTIQGQAEWISNDQAYVVVPYGTARSLHQCWDATAFVPDRDKPERAREVRVKAQLVSADATHGLESETEGLLLRLTRVGDGRRLSRLVDALPSS